jgi:hypothetical protein
MADPYGDAARETVMLPTFVRSAVESMARVQWRAPWAGRSGVGKIRPNHGLNAERREWFPAESEIMPELRADPSKGILNV